MPKLKLKLSQNTCLIIIGASLILGVGGSICFHEMAADMRRRTAEETQRLADLQKRLEMQDSLARTDSLNKSIVTPDLAFFSLHGRVREVHTSTITATFDKEGRWTNPQAYVSRSGYNLTFERNKFGYVIKGVAKEKVNGRPVEEIAYEWKDGLLRRVVSNGYDADYQIDYTYDSHNRLLTEHTVCTSEEGTSEISSSYTYQAFDRMGNWTRREVRSAIKNTETEGYYDEDNDTFIDNDTPIIDSNSETQVRTITYY